MNRTTTLIIAALLLIPGCFQDVPENTSDGTSGTSGTSAGTSSQTSGAATDSGGSTGAVSSGSGSGTSTGGSTDSPGSTGDTAGSTGGMGSTGSPGSTGTGSTGSSDSGSTGGGGPLFPDQYAPCEEHAECMSGVCVESFSRLQQDAAHGFCSFVCDPMGADPCAGGENPFPTPAVAECFWHPPDETYYCGIQCAGGCPVGWGCQSTSNQMGQFGACFESV